MWGGMTGAPPPPMGMMYGGGTQVQQQNQQKHDIFVGNLAFNTTEDQLHQAFSEIGRVLKVRLVTDSETGKPRGFAFVEFEDPQAALSAIRNMNEYELNGRRLRVNFSNSSHLEALAGKLGMDLSQNQNTQSNQQRGGDSNQNKSSNQGHQTGASGSQGQGQQSGAGGGNQGQQAGGTQAVADALKAMSKGEMYDVIAKLKEIADRDPDEARRIISGHPQLPEAILFLMSKLDMVKTPITTDSAAVLPPTQAGAAAVPGVVQPANVIQAPAQQAADPRTRAMDPRARAMDPRQAAANVAPPAAAPTAPPPQVVAPPRADPRQAARVDPRRAAAMQQQQQMPPQQPPPQQLAPPPPMQQQQYGMPPSHMQPQQVPPPPPQHQQTGAIANLDPSLVQQVMSLTPQQIAQLPPDKQQSILALRQQIAGAGM